VIRVVLVYLLPIDVMVGVSTGLTGVTYAALIAWTARRMAAARPAAAPAVAASAAA
jgi:hypothetical protein